MNIDVAETRKISSQDPFWAIRGHAIEAYAGVEQSLCALFAHLTGMHNEVAGVIFFRITNPRVLGEILDILMKKKYVDEYSKFWKSVDKIIRKLVETRNRLVHWNVANTSTNTGNYLRASKSTHDCTAASR